MPTFHSKFIVEHFGYNDGVPYQIYETEDVDDARNVLKVSRRDRPKVPHRLIQVLEEHPASE